MGDDLYREICRCPEDDTLRLAYADWLDENGDPDRAEFVRLDVERHRRWPDFTSVCEADRPTTYPDWQRLEVVESRLWVLGTAHPEWSRFPCLECEGKGYVMVDTGVDMPAIGGAKGGRLHRSEQCPVCSGTGDLFLVFGVSGASLTPPPKPRTVTFARGFPDAVSCTLSEAFTPDGIPTPWACEVVRRTPVTRFVLTDRRPVRVAAGFGWVMQDDPALPEHVPSAVWRELPYHFAYDVIRGARVISGGDYSDEADVHLNVRNLTAAAGRAVRKHVYGEVTA